MIDKEYELCKDACDNAGCHCPPSHEFHSAVANTYMFIRAYFLHKGFEECKKEFANCTVNESEEKR